MPYRAVNNLAENLSSRMLHERKKAGLLDTPSSSPIGIFLADKTGANLRIRNLHEVELQTLVVLRFSNMYYIYSRHRILSTRNNVMFLFIVIFADNSTIPIG